MPRVPPFDRRATYEDLLGLPGHLVAEIVDGELHASSIPEPRTAGIAVALCETLRRALDTADDERWQILPEPELHLGSDILVPALAAWRHARLPELPLTAHFSVAPDWVCETVAMGTASLRARKMAIYAGEGVPHAWLIDPVARMVEVRRLERGRWTVLASLRGSHPVHAEPFEVVDFSLAILWPRGR